MNLQLLSWLLFLAGAIFGLLWLAYTIKQKFYEGIEVREFLFSPDGQRLYGSGQYRVPRENYGLIWAWETTTGRLLWRQQVETMVTDLALASDSTSLLTTGTRGHASPWDEGGALLWDAETGASRFPLKDERRSRTTDNVYVSPDGLRLFGCFQEGIQVWGAKTGEYLAFWPVPGSWPTRLYFSPDGTKLIVEASMWSESEAYPKQGSHFVQLWDAHTGQQIQDFQIERRAACAFSPDSKQIALVQVSRSPFGEDNWIKISRLELWTVEGERIAQSPEFPEDFEADGLTFQPDGNVFCNGVDTSQVTEAAKKKTYSWFGRANLKGQAFLWDIPTDQIEERPRPDPEEQTLSPDGRRKVVANEGAYRDRPPLGTLYNAETGEKLCDLEGLAGH
ncbi:MAG: hypothetical protein QM758_07105 [Armatimonas sp.]